MVEVMMGFAPGEIQIIYRKKFNALINEALEK
jgi:hypothetical protein